MNIYSPKISSRTDSGGLNATTLGGKNTKVLPPHSFYEKGAMTMEYFEVPEARPGQDAICSDNDCPCGYPGAKIPRGSGYMYISQTVVDFRRDARTLREAEQKIARMQQQMNILFDQNVVVSTLMCEQGARKRGLDLDVAAADAKYWWETGLVPLRATPLTDSTEAKKESELLKSRVQTSPEKRPASSPEKSGSWGSESIDDILEHKYEPKKSMGQKASFKDILFSFKGRLSRSDYWKKAFPVLFIFGLIIGIIQAIEIESSGESALSILFYLVFLWPVSAVAAKRLHDRNRSGWLLLTLMIPFISIIFAIWLGIEIWFFKGTAGNNRFGPDPSR
jgi:uncharacterized membrane protein YhaH (DUF805 family)